MTNEERKAAEAVKNGIREFLEYMYMNSNIKFTDEMKREVENKNLPLNYTTLYEAYLNTSDKLKESDYKLYQVSKYLDEELVYTRDGLQFLKYTKEGRNIKDILDGKREYKVKRKWWWINKRYHWGD